MTDDLQEFDEDLRDLEQDLLSVAEGADEVGVPLLSRNFEIWSHTVAVFRSELNDEDPPGTIMDYLQAREDYDTSEEREG